MDISLSTRLGTSAPIKTTSAPQLAFTAMPQLSPATAQEGAVFSLSLGDVSPAPASLSGVLMLDGVDVSNEIVSNGEALSYTSTQPGALSWHVTADDGAGGLILASDTAVVSADMSPVVYSLDGIDVTIAGAEGVIEDATGRPYAVAPQGLTVVELPATGTIDGYLVGGAQVNPERLTSSVGRQGYDARTLEDPVDPNYVASLTASAPFDMTAGDRLVQAVPDTGSRSYGEPLNSGYRTLHVVSAPLPANAVLAPSVGWAGRTGPDYFEVDMPALKGLLKNFSAAGLNLPPFDVLMQSLDVMAPVFAQNSATYRGVGYEPFMPPGIAGRVISGNALQYGRDIAETFEIAAIGLHYDAYTDAQKEQILWTLIRHGVEWGFPIIGSNLRIAADGGHQQFWQFATIVALIATGRENEVADFMTATGGGNWDQFFEVTPDLIASDFSAHSDPSLPQMWRLRTLGAQPGGAVVRVPMSSDDQGQTKLPKGASVIRDGRVVGYTTLERQLTTSGVVDVPLDMAPVPGFTAGDVIHFEAPAGAMMPGRHDWLQRPGYGTSGLTGGATYFSPSATNQYRELQRVMGQMLSLRGLGYMHSSVAPVWGYIKDIVGNSGERHPDADNDYPTPLASFEALDGNAYSFMGSPYRAQMNAFDILPQVYDTVPAQPIAITSIVSPDTKSPGPLADGQVIGLTGGVTYTPVAISGTAGPDSTVQLRILRQSDGSEVRGWFAAKPTRSGTFNVVVDLSKADDWWRLEMRYAGSTQVYTEDTRWAVGYKFLMLGQSQMTILLKGAGLGYTMQPANLGTASFYTWQEHNLSGATEGESLSVLEAGTNISDGLGAFVDQYRVLDPDTPIQLVRESVNGTSVLDFTDDTLGARMWSDLTDKTDKYGADITAVLENWNTANQGALEGSEDIDILQGFDAHLSEHGAVPTHGLRDVLRPGYAYATMPATRNSKLFNDVDHSVAKIVRANALGYPVGVPVGDYEIDDDGGPHPLATGQGNVRFGARLAILAARSVGLSAVPQNPHFAGTATRSADGMHIDLPVVLPNGGVLSSQAPNALSGFRVNENGAGYSASGFTTAIVGTDTVRLTKTSGSWASAAQLVVGRLANLPINAPIERATEQTIMAGELYETWAGDVTGVGLPVHGKLNASGEWTLQGAIAPTVVQDNAGGGGTADVRLLKAVDVIDTTVSTNNRERMAYGVLVDGGQVVPEGTEVLLAAFHVPDWGGGSDFTSFSVRNSAMTSVGSLNTLATEVNTPGGFARSIRAFSFVQAGVGLDFRGFTNSRSTMSSMLAYRLEGVTLTGAVAGNGDNTVTLSNVPAGSTIVAFAQGTSPIGWNGLTQDTVHVGSFAGSTWHQAVAVGTGAGTVSVTASNASELVVVALPPV